LNCEDLAGYGTGAAAAGSAARGGRGGRAGRQINHHSGTAVDHGRV